MSLMELLLRTSCPFNLDLTLCCGQAFRWEKQPNCWWGVVKGRVVKIRQTGSKLVFEGVNENFIVEYLGLKDDLSTIHAEINRDDYIGAAIKYCQGLRLLRQEPWECLISYICATYKNIASIKRMLLALSRRFGEEIYFEGRSYFKFPEADKLAAASLKELAKCELGYRAKYVSETSKKVIKNGLAIEDLRNMPYDAAKKVLLDFPGVGQKVADCVLLFSIRKFEAFPVDVWVRRAVIGHYRSHFPREFIQRILRRESLTDSEYKSLSLFGREYFGKHAGYAQEYLYHYERVRSTR